MRLGLIGFGTIASEVSARLRDEAVSDDPVRIGAVLSPRALAAVDAASADAASADAASADAAGTPLDATFADTRALLDWRPDLIVECAGHTGAAEHVPACLAAGVDVVLVSVGALADAALLARLERAAAEGGARMILPAGAIGALDLLGALALGGIDTVDYRGIKPPAGWYGSAAERTLDLAALDVATVFFDGDARQAAREYPKNANVAATLALHGIGFERTRVTLVADPAAAGNTHEITVRAASGDYTLRVDGRASPGNARTSMTTVFSVLHEIGSWRRVQGGA